MGKYLQPRPNDKMTPLLATTTFEPCSPPATPGQRRCQPVRPADDLDGKLSAHRRGRWT
ncbi:MAG: hypothetical protein R2788_01615 [Saprospiraceae bacterium]